VLDGEIFKRGGLIAVLRPGLHARGAELEGVSEHLRLFGCPVSHPSSPAWLLRKPLPVTNLIESAFPCAWAGGGFKPGHASPQAVSENIETNTPSECDAQRTDAGVWCACDLIGLPNHQ
jgi:hypothetical protein